MSRVICVGEALIDFMCSDRVSRLQEGINFIKKAGGAPANVCAAITKLGGSAAFVGKIGKDSFGKFLYSTLEELNIDMKYCLYDNALRTTLAIVSVDKHGERDFEFIRGADEAISPSEINFEDFDEAGIIHLGSATALLGGRLYETYEAFVNYAVKKQKIISFDVNYREDLFRGKSEIFKKRCKEILVYTDIVKVSLEEGKMLTGESDIEMISNTLHDFGAKVVVITLGSEGSSLSINKEQIHIPSIPVKMIDATGAGDAYIGALLTWVSKEENPRECLLDREKMKKIVEIANKVGAQTTLNYGAIEAMPTLREVL